MSDAVEGAAAARKAAPVAVRDCSSGWTAAMMQYQRLFGEQKRGAVGEKQRRSLLTSAGTSQSSAAAARQRALISGTTP